MWCAACGAKTTIEAGKAARCGRCDTPLLPTCEGGASSRRRWLKAQQRRIRQERRVALWIQSGAYFLDGRGCLLAFAVAGFGALGLLALFGMFQADGRLFTVAAITAVATVLSVRVVARFRRCDGGRWPRLKGLVAHHGGRRLARFREVLAWLNVNWPSYYSPLFLAHSGESDYAALTRDGVEVMVNLHLRIQAHDLLDASRLHLLLATPLDVIRDEAPGKIDLNDDARSAGEELMKLGFSAEVCRSGVALQATPGTVRNARDDGIPSRLLEDALEQGLRLVRALEGVSGR